MEKAKAGGEDEGYLLRNIGIMIGETEDYEGAKVFFERALALDEKDGEAWFNLALSWEKTGRLEVAIPMYQTSARNGFQAAIDLLKKNNMEY
jgi:tetratricopeptide (TPR) repeat protein